MTEDEEGQFQSWYREHSSRLGLDPDPDNPLHFYDYRAAFKAGAAPDESGHWPSTFKRAGHPNLFVEGRDTRTGAPIPTAPFSTTPELRDTEYTPASFALVEGLKERGLPPARPSRPRPPAEAQPPAIPVDVPQPIVDPGEYVAPVTPDLKEGVEWKDMDPAVNNRWKDVQRIHRDITGRDPIVTSGREGEHMEGSLHYEGRAFDIRTRDMTGSRAISLTQKLQDELGEDWFVMYEREARGGAHIHVEYDPADQSVDHARRIEEVSGKPPTGRERREKNKNVLGRAMDYMARLRPVVGVGVFELPPAQPGEPAAPGRIESARQLGRGLTHGTMGTFESVGTALQFAGARMGNESVQQFGKQIADTWENLAKDWEMPEDLQGAVLDDPSLMMHPAWIAYMVGEIAPSLIVSMAPGMGAAKYISKVGTMAGMAGKTIQIGNKVFRWTPSLVQRAATIGAATAGFVTGGGLEATSTYREMLELTGDENLARNAAGWMFLAAGTLNSVLPGLAARKMLGGKTLAGRIENNFLRYLASGAENALAEGLTEWAEEPSEILIKSLSTQEFTPEMAYNQWRQSFNVIIPSMIMGGSTTALEGMAVHPHASKDPDANQNPFEILDVWYTASDADVEEAFQRKIKDVDPATHPNQDQKKLDEYIRYSAAKEAILDWNQQKKWVESYKKAQSQLPPEALAGDLEFTVTDDEGNVEVTPRPPMDEDAHQRYVGFYEAGGEPHSDADRDIMKMLAGNLTPEEREGIRAAIAARLGELGTDEDYVGHIDNLEWALGMLEDYEGIPVGVTPIPGPEPAPPEEPAGAAPAQPPGISDVELPGPTETPAPIPVPPEAPAPVSGPEEAPAPVPGPTEAPGEAPVLITPTESPEEPTEAPGPTMAPPEAPAPTLAPPEAPEAPAEAPQEPGRPKNPYLPKSPSHAGWEAFFAGQEEPEPGKWSPKAKKKWKKAWERAQAAQLKMQEEGGGEEGAQPTETPVPAPEGEEAAAGPIQKGQKVRLKEQQQVGSDVLTTDLDFTVVGRTPTSADGEEYLLVETPEGEQYEFPESSFTPVEAETSEFTPVGSIQALKEVILGYHNTGVAFGQSEDLGAAKFSLDNVNVTVRRTQKRGERTLARYKMEYSWDGGEKTFEGGLAEVLKNADDFFTERMEGKVRRPEPPKAPPVTPPQPPTTTGTEPQEELFDNKEKLLETLYEDHLAGTITAEGKTYSAEGATILVKRNEARDGKKYELWIDGELRASGGHSISVITENIRNYYQWLEDMKKPPTSFTPPTQEEEEEGGTAPVETPGGQPSEGEEPEGVGTPQEGGEAEGVSGTKGKGGKGGVSGTGGQASGGKAGGLDLGDADGGRDGGQTDTGSDNLSDEQPDSEDTPATNPDLVRGTDYNITPGELDNLGGPKQRARQNLAAIRLVKALEQENRPATREEQAVLVKYVGWGGLPQIFPLSSWRKEWKQGWYELGTELQALLTETEYKAAKKSTQNAHYTTPEVIDFMYGALGHMGVGGKLRVLEPGAGIGHFLGLSPLENARFTTVEIDEISAKILGFLYPNQSNFKEGYEKTILPDNAFDVVVGNPPFADLQIYDPRYGKKPVYYIHDYFFIKSLEKLRPGGILAFVTSAGTLDKKNIAARQAMAERADFLGAIRLPGGTFSKNANTMVTTDIIFFQKRAPGVPANHRGDFVTIGKAKDANPDIAPELSNSDLNAWYIAHPEMMLGELVRDPQSGYGKRPKLGLAVPADENLEEWLAAKLEDAFSYLPTNVFTERNQTLPPIERPKNLPPGVKEGQWVVVDGDIKSVNGKKVDSIGIAPEGKVFQRVSHLIQIGEKARILLDLNRESGTDEQLAIAQKELSKAYDAFVKKYGPINKQTITKSGTISRPNLRQFKCPVNGPLIRGMLESYDEETGKATKRAIFTKRMHGVVEEIGQISEPWQALVASLWQHGEANMEYIAELLETDPETAAAALRGHIFKDPTDGVYKTREAYLTGNIKAKLALAKEAAEKVSAEFEENVKALEEVMPEPITAQQLRAMNRNEDGNYLFLGTTWITTGTYELFASEVLGMRDSRVQYREADGAWSFTQGKSTFRPSYRKFSTSRVGADVLFRHILTRTRTEVYDEVDDPERPGKKMQVRNFDDEELAEDMKVRIQDRFAKWLLDENPQRAAKALDRYDELMNTHRIVEFDGSHLRNRLPGIAAEFRGKPLTLRDFQLNTVWRYLSKGNLLIAQEVGAGKTMEMVIMGQEAKRLGIARKPVYVVPNGQLQQWEREYLELYPAAKILVADSDNFKKDNRQKFLAQVAGDDWDAVVMGHSQLTMIPTTPETEREIVARLVAEMEQTLDAARQDQIQHGGTKSFTVKRIENALDKLRVKLQQLMDVRRSDKFIYWEDLGFDLMFVDEAHDFKNLQLPSLTLNPKGAQKATDLYIKTRYLEHINPGRGLVFATATPISNTISELYVMMRYLMEAELKAEGSGNYDAWANNFVGEWGAVEATAIGTMEVKYRPRAYMNGFKMAQMFRSVADVKTAKDLESELVTPPLIGGEPEDVIIPISDRLRDFMINNIQKRWEERPKRPQKGEDNVLSIMNDARYGSLDARMVNSPHALRRGHDNQTPWTHSKAEYVANKVFEVWQETKDFRGVQLIFSDLGIPQKLRKAEREAIEAALRDLHDGSDMTEAELQQLIEDAIDHGNYDLYNDIKERLLALGIPAKEIAFIQEAGSNKEERQRIIDRANSGQVRVLIGSTPTMGQGVNVQQRVVAGHHVDVPWKTAHLQQRDGRYIRQGNLLYDGGKIEGVRSFRYILEGGFDQRSWQIIQNKAGFIIQAMTATPDIGSISEVSENTLEAQEVYAILKGLATENPYMLDLEKKSRQYRSLANQKQEHEDRKISNQRLITSLSTQRRSLGSEQYNWERATRNWTDTTGENFEITLSFPGEKQGTKYTDRKDASKAILKWVEEAEARGVRPHSRATAVTIGVFGGSKVMLNWIDFVGWEEAQQGQLQDLSQDVQAHLAKVQARRKGPGKISKWKQFEVMLSPEDGLYLAGTFNLHPENLVGAMVALENLSIKVRDYPAKLKADVADLTKQIEALKSAQDEAFPRQTELENAHRDLTRLRELAEAYKPGDLDVRVLETKREDRSRGAVQFETIDPNQPIEEVWDGRATSPDSPYLSSANVYVLTRAIDEEDAGVITKLQEVNNPVARGDSERTITIDTNHPTIATLSKSAVEEAHIIGVVPADKEGRDERYLITRPIAVVENDQKVPFFFDAKRLRWLQGLVGPQSMLISSGNTDEETWLVFFKDGQIVGMLRGESYTHYRQYIDPDIVREVTQPMDPREEISMLRTGEGTIGAGMDPKIFQTLGASQYAGNIGKISTKELIQNALDSLRPAIEGGRTSPDENAVFVKLNMGNDDYSFRIEVEDNGHGMTEAVVEKEWVDLGGSIKFAKESSGGFGLAKVAYFALSQNLHMETVAFDPSKGYKTRVTVDGTGDQWVKGSLKINVEKVPDDTQTGTTQWFDFPTNMEVEPDYFKARNFLNLAAKYSNLPVIFYDGKNREPIKGQVGYTRYTGFDGQKTKTLKFKGAEVEITPSSDHAYSGITSLLYQNFGLFQWEANHWFMGEGKYPANIKINIKPKVGVNSTHYPFLSNREGLKEEISLGIDNYLKTWQLQAQKDQYKSIVDALKNRRVLTKAKGLYLYDTSGTLRSTDDGKAFIKMLQKAQWTADFASEVVHAANVTWDAIMRYELPGAIEEASFEGIGLGGDYYGANIPRKAVEETRKKIIEEGGTVPESGIDATNLVLMNPFAYWMTAKTRAETLGIPEGEERIRFMAEYSGDRIVATIVHEQAHQVQRDHSEKYASIFTEFEGRTSRVKFDLAYDFGNLFYEMFASPEFNKHAQIYLELEIDKKKNVLAGLKGEGEERVSFARTGLQGGNAPVVAGQAGRSTSQQPGAAGAGAAAGGSGAVPGGGGGAGRGPGGGVPAGAAAGGGPGGQGNANIRGIGGAIRAIGEPTGILIEDFEGDHKERVAALVVGIARNIRYRKDNAVKVAQKWEDLLRKHLKGNKNLLQGLNEAVEEALEDIGAAVEGIDNIRTGKGITQIRREIANDPVKKRILQEYRNLTEEARNDLNTFLEDIHGPEYVQYISDYLAHFYAGRRRRLSLFAEKWTKKVRSAAKRTFPTLQEAMDQGFVPITQNVAQLHRTWAEVNWKGAVNQRFVYELQRVVNDDGLPVIMKPNQAPHDWKIVNHPAIQKIYARKTKDGKTLLWTGGAAVDPTVERMLRQVFEQPFSWRIVQSLEVLNAFAKKAALSVSFFHHFALTESAQGALARIWAPARGVFLIEKGLTGGINLPGGVKLTTPHREGLRLLASKSVIRDMTLHGLNIDPIPDVMSGRVVKALHNVEARTRRIPGLGWMARKIRQANQKWDEALWNRYYTGLKAFAYYDLVKEQMARMPQDATPDQIRRVKEKVASHVNDMFGGQEWDGKFWLTPQGRQAMHLLLLAPDWTLSNLQVAGKTISEFKDPVSRKILVRYWRNMLLSFGAMVSVANRFCGGKWPWENEQDHKLDIDVTCIMKRLPWSDAEEDRRYYIKLGKQFREVLRYVQNPVNIITAKLSPSAQVALEQATGHQGGHIGWEMAWVREDMGFYESLPSRTLAIMEKFVPFAARGNNFALTFPLSKGMSWYKAQKAYEDLIRAQVDPNVYQRILPRQQADELKAKIDDAAVLNGLDPAEQYRQANTKVRADYYQRLWQYIEKEKLDDADEVAKILLELGVDPGGIRQSGARRGVSQEGINQAVGMVGGRPQRPRRQRPSRPGRPGR